MTVHTACEPIANAPRSGDAIRQWLRNAARSAFFSALIGLSLSLIEPTLYGLAENLVYSECIGLSIYAGITLLGSPFPSAGRARPFRHYLLRGLIAVPLGLFVGLNLAAALRGNPTGFAVLNRAAIFALPITIVASIGTMYFLWSRKRIADASAANALAQRHIAEARLKLLQAQIEPHMLFNTLANLRTLVEVDPARAQTMLDQLIVYLRGTLAASRADSRAATTTLEHEFAHLAAYLELMRVRMASRLRIAIDLPESLRACAIPPMLLQPLVENAIKHGLEPKIDGGTVRVVASIVEATLRIEVSDDGIGLVDDRPGVDGGSYGLAHVRDRLQALYGDAARLVIAPRPGGGVSARVELPA